jgi:hypothetical protein
MKCMIKKLTTVRGTILHQKSTVVCIKSVVSPTKNHLYGVLNDSLGEKAEAKPDTYLS